MQFLPTNISEVVLLKPAVFGDERGFFVETWRDEWLHKLPLATSFVQDNHSKSSQGVLRGLHYQLIQAQGKLVRVTQGAVWDVAVDMRRNSPTFGQHVAVELSADNKHMLWVPPGFAHGFYTLTDTAEFQYKCTDYYAPAHERCVRWDDPDLGIAWPLVAGQAPSVSHKDAAGAAFASAEYY